jgi:hypothetical protein
MNPEAYRRANEIARHLDTARKELKVWETFLDSRSKLAVKSMSVGGNHPPHMAFECLPDSIFDSFRHFAILSLKETITLLEREFDEL